MTGNAIASGTGRMINAVIVSRREGTTAILGDQRPARTTAERGIELFIPRFYDCCVLACGVTLPFFSIISIRIFIFYKFDLVVAYSLPIQFCLITAVILPFFFVLHLLH